MHLLSRVVPFSILVFPLIEGHGLLVLHLRWQHHYQQSFSFSHRLIVKLDDDDHNYHHLQHQSDWSSSYIEREKGKEIERGRRYKTDHRPTVSLCVAGSSSRVFFFRSLKTGFRRVDGSKSEHQLYLYLLTLRSTRSPYFSSNGLCWSSTTDTAVVIAT